MSIAANQKQLLDRVAVQLPENISLVRELADLLEISTDSAYRRIRGETELSFREAILLCQRYQLSMDAFMHPDANQVNFTYHPYGETPKDFETYFLDLSEEMKSIAFAPFEHKHISFLGPGIPILHFMGTDMLCRFRLFHWINSMGPKDKKFKTFDESLLSDAVMEASMNIFRLYMETPSTEIWTDSSILGIVHQLRFAWEAGILSSKEKARQICDELKTMLNNIEEQAENGFKTYVVNEVRRKGANYQLYYSEMEDENTCIHVEIGDHHTIYMGHWNHRFLKTNNSQYAETTKKWYQNLMRKSTLLSETSASTRYRFFKRSHDRVDAFLDMVSK